MSGADYPELAFTVGMPNMAPDQLSEVELLKIFAEFQWVQLGEALGTPSHRLMNEAGDRLYASVVQVEESFGRGESIARFQEGDRVHLRGTVRFHAGHFVEGWTLLGHEPVPVSAIESIETLADLAKLDTPWLCMTNAMVARMADNNRLKTFSPAGIAERDVRRSSEKPHGLVQHERVMRGDPVPAFAIDEPLVALPARERAPFSYAIQLENDLNGAGLLYFARYVAMMNQAERRFLLERMPTPFSLPLYRFVSTERRRSFFFANANEGDEVEIHCKGWAIDPGTTRKRGELRSEVARFLFEFELYRKRDGVLMAKSIATRSLTVPNRFSGLRAEAQRFTRALCA